MKAHVDPQLVLDFDVVAIEGLPTFLQRSFEWQGHLEMVRLVAKTFGMDVCDLDFTVLGHVALGLADDLILLVLEHSVAVLEAYLGGFDEL